MRRAPREAGGGRRAAGGSGAHHSGPLPARRRQLPVAKQLPLFLWRLRRLLLIGEAPLSRSISPVRIRSRLLASKEKTRLVYPLALPHPPQNSRAISEVWTKSVPSPPIGLPWLGLTVRPLLPLCGCAPWPGHHDYSQGAKCSGEIRAAAGTGNAAFWSVPVRACVGDVCFLDDFLFAMTVLT